ncbi:MAG: G/U mismatch-specific DNA glycosylase [Anaerolineae bacterium]|nr:G/U mismatch-specific DNA glycosylase [Anaerolineae bacterium]
MPDLVAPNLRILFCGINPGLYSAAIGHHFGHPSNRFWRALYEGGLTARLLSPYQDAQLLKAGYGITNLVARATATAADLTREELVLGGERLASTVDRYHPRCLAVLGIGAYRQAFGERDAQVGLRCRRIAGARLCVLPNPSGLNAHYKPEDLARLFRELRQGVDAS